MKNHITVLVTTKFLLVIFYYIYFGCLNHVETHAEFLQGSNTVGSNKKSRQLNFKKAQYTQRVGVGLTVKWKILAKKKEKEKEKKSCICLCVASVYLLKEMNVISAFSLV